MKLAPEVLAFRFLKKPNLTRAKKLLILTGMDFENKTALYEQAKKALDFGKRSVSKIPWHNHF